MAILARLGGVQPSEFEEMDFTTAVELAKRLAEMYKDEQENRMQFDLECTKGIMRASGARVPE